MADTETGTMVWFDFPTKDEAKSIDFYSKVFSWEFSPMGSDYFMIKAGSTTIGGLRVEKKSEFKPADGFISYFRVRSIQEGSDLIQKYGGKLVGPVVDINGGESGYHQNFSDLDGNQLSIWSIKK